mmetsp:Transcript_6359/g.12928  ORF Transcript_6359/g.12928 Transcript_6359/m.12928 type:complete len:114 (-) Transcript_6359:27-368(-)
MQGLKRPPARLCNEVLEVSLLQAHVLGECLQVDQSEPPQCPKFVHSFVHSSANRITSSCVNSRREPSAQQLTPSVAHAPFLSGARTVCLHHRQYLRRHLLATPRRSIAPASSL